MNRLIFLLTLMVLPLGLFAQQINEVIYDEDAEQDILYGYCTIEAFRNEPFKAWFEPAYNDYKPDEATVAQLKTLIEGSDIRIVLGTWCSDSRREVPRFLKVLKAIDYPLQRLEIIGLNRLKRAPHVGIGEGYVDFVPTFFFFSNGVEVGRIVETPYDTLEADMMHLLERQIGL